MNNGYSCTRRQHSGMGSKEISTISCTRRQHNGMGNKEVSTISWITVVVVLEDNIVGWAVKKFLLFYEQWL